MGEARRSHTNWATWLGGTGLACALPWLARKVILRASWPGVAQCSTTRCGWFRGGSATRNPALPAPLRRHGRYCGAGGRGTMPPGARRLRNGLRCGEELPGLTQKRGRCAMTHHADPLRIHGVLGPARGVAGPGPGAGASCHSANGLGLAMTTFACRNDGRLACGLCQRSDRGAMTSERAVGRPSMCMARWQGPGCRQAVGNRASSSVALGWQKWAVATDRSGLPPSDRGTSVRAAYPPCSICAKQDLD